MKISISDTYEGTVYPVILLTQKSIFHDLTFSKMSIDTCHQGANREQPFNKTNRRNNLIALCNGLSKMLITCSQDMVLISDRGFF